jgi:hypothetical protein
MASRPSTIQRPPLPRRLTLGALAGLSLLLVLLTACQIIEARERYAVEIVTEGQTWNEEGLDNILTALNKLPPHVVRRLGNRYYGRLQVLSNPGGVTIEGWQPYANGANFYSNYNDRNQLVLVPNQSVFTILHELGHAYQMREVPSNRYAWVFFQSEMREFMDATGWKLLNTDAEIALNRDVASLRFEYTGPQVWQTLSHFDPVEDYANSFAMYFQDPAQLQVRSPARYAFIRDHVAKDAR